jgi:sensor histidine kinase YesM
VSYIPDYNDFTILVSGFLITLSVYHFLLYFQHKDSTYLFYSLYTFLIFTSSYPVVETSIFVDVIANNDPQTNFVVLPREWLYNTMYLMFAKTLVDFKTYKPKFNKLLNISIVIFISTLIISLLLAYFLNTYSLVGKAFTYFFSPTIAIIALICFYVLYTMDTKLKYYVLIGSFSYLILAEYAFYMVADKEMATVVFYIGIIIENIFFALALGYKQKLILHAKNASQKKLIDQLQENDLLKETINIQLEKELSLLSKQVEIDKLDSINSRYEKELAELKVTLLRTQMNPHFIFNSLNSIKLYIINNEKENAVYYLNKFSKLIRKILASTREKEISLAEELETMELYMNIENIRFENKIDYRVAIDDSISTVDVKLPCMILQPIIENSIWHGLSLKKGPKKIDIKVNKRNDSSIIIAIEDNGIGRDKSKALNGKKLHKKGSLGLKLTQERLKDFYKEFKNVSSLQFSDLVSDNRESTGTRVVLSIPLQ